MEQLCDLVTDGTHDSPKLQVEGVPFIKGKHISGGTVDFSTCDFITREDHEQACKRVKPQCGDILFSNIGSVGDTAVVKVNREFSIKNVALLRPDGRKIDRAYFYYLVLSPEFRANVMNIRSGAAQPFISLANLRAFEVSYDDDLEVQRRIAGILSAYDELIENSQRRIKILESMARALYREWFVHFRFPGHESVPRLPSALGDIPQGWEVKKLGEVATITMGLSPKGDTYNEQGDGTPLVNGPVEFGDRFTKQLKWTTAPTKLCHDGDLVVCVRGSTTGKYVKSDGEYCLGRGVCGMNSKHQAHLDLLFQAELPRLLGQTSGSTFPSWTGPQLQSHPVLSPPSKLLERFEEIAKPMSAAIATYVRRIENLRLTRDMLLPKLLTKPTQV